MKSNLTFSFVFILLFLFSEQCLAQIHLPKANSDRHGLLNFKQFTTTSEKIKPKEILSRWYSLPLPSDGPITQVSIACDVSEMVIFYREPDYSINIDMGPIKKWDGSGWIEFAGATSQCHNPDIDIDGTVVVATWYDDGNDYGYGSNINGPWVSFTGTLLSHQYYPRAAMAMGLPYMSFACRYSDGMPSSYLMLHVKHIVGTGSDIELNGGWRYPGNDIGLKTDLVGDNNAWYCAYTQKGYIVVDKGSIINGTHEYSDLGEGFRMSSTAFNPEIALFNGNPVVAWLENSGSEIYVAEWNGEEWLVIGTVTIINGSAADIRMASGSLLYVIYTINGAEENISINSYDGNDWYEYPTIQDKLNTDINTADIALYKNEPVVAFTQGEFLTIKIYSDKSPISDVSDLFANPSIKCFPNPFDDHFTIELGKTYSDIHYEIKSVSGQLIVRKEIKSASFIRDTFVANPGIYIIDIFSGKDKISSLNLIKK